MSSLPPPLPTLARKNEGNSFAKQASTACLLAPFIAIAIGMAFNYTAKNLQGPNLRLAAMASGWLSIAVAGIGSTLGILAILLMKQGGRAGIVVRSVAGLVITGLLAAIAVPNFVRARTAALARIDAAKELRLATKNVQNEVAANLTNHTPSSQAVEHFQEKLDEAAAKSTGEDAVMIRAAQSYLRQVQAAQADYQKALQELTAAHVLATSNLVSHPQIHDRELIVHRFLQCNESLSNFVSNSREIFSEELASVHVSKENIDIAVAGFERVAKPQQPLVAQIRGDDGKMGNAMLGVLELLDSHWGHWQYSSTAPHLVFEDREALAHYNSYLADIREAGSDQAAAQTKLASIVQHLPAQ